MKGRKAMVTIVERLQRDIETAARDLEECVTVAPGAQAPLSRWMVQSVSRSALAKLRRVQKRLGELDCGGCS